MSEVTALDGGDEIRTITDKIALIDADSIVWASCSVCTNNVPMLPEAFYTEEEWAEILVDPNYYEDLGLMSSIDLDEAYEHAKNKIEKILYKTECKDYELHFTSGRKSFRYTQVDPMYKANRLPENQAKPKEPIQGLSELKQRFIDEGKGTTWYDWEADDIVTALKSQYPDKYVLVALDKDVLYTLPGKHFNYYYSELYNIPMKWFEVTREEAMIHHYRQTLTGDKGDNVIGLHGIGPKKADKILKGCTTTYEMWEAVTKAYEDNGRTVIDAITNMRLVNMHQLHWSGDKWVLELWRPPTS